MLDYRIGYGEDAHRLEAGRPLWLGGLQIPDAPHGAVAHSDGDAVLRVCWIGDRERLLREAAVGRALPADVGYPEVLAAGALTVDGEAITWMTSRRLSGASLRTVWPELTAQQRDRALRDVVAPLRALHRWRPPAQVAALAIT